MTSVELEVKKGGEVLGTFMYDAPESLEECLNVDGPDKVFKLYARTRQNAAIQAERQKMIAKDKVSMRDVMQAIKNIMAKDPNFVAEVLSRGGADAPEEA